MKIINSINLWWENNSKYFIYLFALTSALSISAMTVILAVFLLFYLLNFLSNYKKSPKDFIYFIIYYLWASLTVIFNGIYDKIFKSIGDIWDKIPYLSVSVVKIERKTVINFIKILLWVNVIVLAYALLQKYFDISPLIKDLFSHGRFKGYHSHPLRFAGYFSGVCLISFVFASFYSRKFFYVFAFLLVGLILNGSRSYWFSVILTVLILSLFKSKKYFFDMLLFLFLYFIFALFVFSDSLNRVKAIFVKTTSIANIEDIHLQRDIKNVSNLDLRMNFWKAGFQIGSRSPLYGIGDNNVSEYLKPYKEKGLIDNVAHCHNSYITTFAEKGIIGLGFFIFIIVYFIRKYYFRYKNIDDEFKKMLSLSVMALWINVALSGFFEANFSTFVLWGFMSFYMGIVESFTVNN